VIVERCLVAEPAPWSRPRSRGRRDGIGVVCHLDLPLPVGAARRPWSRSELWIQGGGGVGHPSSCRCPATSPTACSWAVRPARRDPLASCPSRSRDAARTPWACPRPTVLW